MPDDLPRIPKKKRPRNKPRDDAWLQQKLIAYRPIYTFRCALPGILIYSFFCIGVSIALYKNSLSVFEYEIDYTECKERNDDRVTHYYEDNKLVCRYHLMLPEVNGNILFYYGLRHFYQNIRTYERSRNDYQLTGKLDKTDDCHPFDTASNNGKDVPIVPCGAVADSMFNDTFNLLYTIPGKNSTLVPLTSDGLLHTSFRADKYHNPKKCSDADEVCPGFEATAKPRSWVKTIAELGDKDTGRGLENFDFIQWMETAALPNFRKLYRKLYQQAGSVFAHGLPSGNYTLLVDYNYNVSEWSGRKMFVIQSNGPMGPKSEFQMYAFFVLGLFLFAFGAFMVLVEFSPMLVESLRNLCYNLNPPNINGI